MIFAIRSEPSAIASPFTQDENEARVAVLITLRIRDCPRNTRVLVDWEVVPFSAEPASGRLRSPRSPALVRAKR